MSEPFAGLLEGLYEGSQTGYGFREDIKARRRRRELEERLAFLREQQEQRAAAEEGRQATTFAQQQDEYNRRRKLGEEVRGYVARPERFRTLGQYASGAPGEREGPPLSADAVAARAVGRTLRGDLSDDEALLVGSGEVPFSAVQPRGLTYEQRLELIREGARARSQYRQPQRVGMTRAQAAALVGRLDLDYSKRNRFGGGVQQHYLSPAQRLDLIEKLTNGTLTPEDLPTPGGDPAAAPSPAPQMFPFHGGGRPQEQGLMDYLRPGPQSMGRPAPAPTSAPAGGGQASLGGVLDDYVNRTTTRTGGQMEMGEEDIDPARVEAALAMLDEFPDLSIADWEDALRADGYSDAEISAILRQVNP